MRSATTPLALTPEGVLLWWTGSLEQEVVTVPNDQGSRVPPPGPGVVWTSIIVGVLLTGLRGLSLPASA